MTHTLDDGLDVLARLLGLLDRPEPAAARELVPLFSKADFSRPAIAVPETLLERLGTYFAFRYLLKAVNDGDLLGQAQFCVLMVLTAQRLTAVCGLWEAVRRLCCEVEHSEENLEALRLAFLRDAALSPGAFLCQLRS